MPEVGRSGADKADAKALVSRLKASSAKVTVVRGDLAYSSAVATAIQTCHATRLSISGIVQGAMGLHEGVSSRA